MDFLSQSAMLFHSISHQHHHLRYRNNQPHTFICLLFSIPLAKHRILLLYIISIPICITLP